MVVVIEPISKKSLLLLLEKVLPKRYYKLSPMARNYKQLSVYKQSARADYKTTWFQRSKWGY